MRRATTRTTAPRVIVATLFSHLAPSMTLGAIYGLFVPGGSTIDGEPFNAMLAGPVFGLLLGWQYLAAGLTAWALLDQIDQHHPWAAALVGLAVGASVVWFSFRDGLFFGLPIAWPLCLGVGLLTGLGVWWIAYGYQSLLPAPPPPRGRLVL